MITWTKDRFDQEIGEFKRFTVEYVEPTPQALKEGLDYLRKKYDRAQPKILLDNKWKNMQNTGSWNTDSIDKIFKNLKRDRIKRDVSRVVTQFFGTGVIDEPNGTVSCPIAVKMGDGSTILVAGNTRLSMSRALGIRPKIIEIETDW
jgi:hypothetical protein